MIKKIFKVIILLVGIVLGCKSSITFSLAPNMDGWRNVGKPTYLQGNSKFTNASDIYGSDIMSRLRRSYTYNTRRAKTLSSNWMQEKLFAYITYDNRYDYTNITYDNLPNNYGVGYTEWYDSPEGIFLDYETQFVVGAIKDTSHGKQNPVVDSIYYNRIQYPGTQQNAFVGSTGSDGALADAKGATILNRRRKTNYPIYLNNGSELDNNIRNELNNKNVRNLWILGGIGRFSSTAGLSSNFNIIRIGGMHRNDTLEFMKNSPDKLKLPSKYSGDDNGIVIKGYTSWLQSNIYNKLILARNNRDVNYIISAANDVFANINIGSTPYPSQEPTLVLGVNYNGWESYVSIYYSQIGGAYVYQFILPDYFKVYEPINNWVDVTQYDYKNGNDYWVKPGNNFTVYTESKMNNSPYGLYPTNTEAILESWNNGYSNSIHGLYPWDNGLYSRESYGNEFDIVWGEKAYRWQRNDYGTLYNYISGNHVIKAKYDNRDYKISSSGHYIDFNTWIGSTPYHNGKWVKTDGTAPTIEGGASTESWTNKNVNISVNSIDNRSGVKYITLSDINSSWSISGKTSISKEISVEGISKYLIKTSDNVGNETQKEVCIKIDKTAPVITGKDIYGWSKGIVTISQTATDSYSGMASMELYNSAGTKVASGISSISYDVTEEGITTYTLKAYDNVGNMSSKTITVKIDNTPPVITGKDIYGWSKGTVTISQTAVDSYSGMASMDLYNSAGTKVASGISSISYDVTKEGITTYTLKAYDNVGNMSSKTITVKIDNTAPTAVSYDVVDRQDDTFTIDIVGVTDNGGSGVASQTVKVWVDTPSGTITKIYEPQYIDSNNSKVVVNRNDFNGVTKTYYYNLTLVDNVGNSRTYSNKTAAMIQNNLVALRLDIYDSKENRYVSQVISGEEYEAVLVIQNQGESDITKSFKNALEIENTLQGEITESSGIKKDEIKSYKFKFIAGDENLLGVNYKGYADYSNVIYETNEDDNIASSEKPYTVARSDLNPPIIPSEKDSDGKPVNPVPIITIKVDLEAYFIDIVELNSDSSVAQVVNDDNYRIKYKVKNNSSLSFKYLDIKNKTFNNAIFYDEKLIGNMQISDMGKDEIKTFYNDIRIPLLDDNIVEDIKVVKLSVDNDNTIKESDESNNILTRNKKVIGLKLYNYRIIDVVNPIVALNYPIYTSSMPLNVKAGYNVTFKVNVIGKADSVYVNIKDSAGKDYGKVSLVKERDIDSISSEWTYVFAPDIDTKDNTIIITNLYAAKNSFVYNYNLKESWNGHTLKIGGNAKEDIVIYRKY